jgi:tRNA (guanine37-N1)-methyltransferase
MKFTLYTLLPQIFNSFFETSLIARGLNQGIIHEERINWREKYGVGGYKQVDDKPFGGGSGMVLQANPIFEALKENNAISQLYQKPENIIVHAKKFPNNADFFSYWQAHKPRSVTISLTPRGFPFTQQTAEWLAENFNSIHMLCGRYEGFDHRVDDMVDLEISLGSFVLNGGEVAAMSIIESVSRLVPGFVTKNTSIKHDSFSSELNQYQENREFVIGKHKLEQTGYPQVQKAKLDNIFDNQWWLENVLPQIEHPQYTRPEVWNNLRTPSVLLDGDHKKIANWQSKWW